MEPNIYHYLMFYVFLLPMPITFIWGFVVLYRWLTGYYETEQKAVRAMRRAAIAAWFQIIVGFVIPMIMLIVEESSR